MNSTIEPPDWLDADEFHFARLSCTRLARFLHGVISIGLPAIATGMPDPSTFFSEQLDHMEPLAVVMGTISGGPSAFEKTLKLRNCSAGLRESISTLRSKLNAATSDAAADLDQALDQVEKALMDVCNGLEAYANRMQLSVPEIDGARQLIIPMMAALPSLALDRVRHAAP